MGCTEWLKPCISIKYIHVLCLTRDFVSPCSGYKRMARRCMGYSGCVRLLLHDVMECGNRRKQNACSY